VVEDYRRWERLLGGIVVSVPSRVPRAVRRATAVTVLAYSSLPTARCRTVVVVNGAADPKDLFRNVSAQAEMRVRAAEAEIAEFAARYAPEGLFASAYFFLIAHPEGDQRGAGSDTSTATLERLVFLLWRADPEGQAPPTPDVVRAVVSRSTDLVRDATLAAGTASRLDDVDRVAGRMLIDSHVVRGSAYPEQTLSEIRGVFAKFDEWFVETLGASATDLADCLLALAFATEEQLNAWIAEIRAETRPLLESDNLPSGPRAKQERCRLRRRARIAAHHAADERIARESTTLFVHRDVCRLPSGRSLSETVWNCLLRLIGFDRGAARELDNALVVRTRPIVVSSDRRALMPNVSTGADALWDALDTHAKSQRKFYSELQAWKGRWLEERVVAYLRRVFGDEAVFSNLRYPNPDQADRRPTELDAAVLYGPFLLLVEAKARQFSLRSQLGDVNRLRDELRANIEDAFEQALRARRYLLGSETAIFSESGTGRTLAVAAAGLTGVVLMTVSLHFLGSAATRLAELRRFGLMGGNEYPWALSVSELDLITRVCEGPDVFIHYARRRLQVELAAEFPMNDDLDLYGAYLSTRLNREDFQALAPGAHFVYLAEYQEVFDSYVDAERRGEELPDLGLVLPPSVRDVFASLRRYGPSTSALKAALALLDCSRGQLAQLGHALSEIQSQQPPPGVYRRLTLVLGDLTVSLTVAGDGPLEALEKRTAERAAREKYRRRTHKAIGLGIHRGLPPRAFHAYTWLEGEWTPNTEMEQQLAEEDAWVPTGQPLPGRRGPV
jgi:hypothetical protein